MKNDYGGSHTPKEIKDLWQTPKPVFRGMDREFEFVADVAANKANALIPRYITEEMDTLHYPWGAVAMPGEYVWLNPPILIRGHSLIKRRLNTAETISDA